MDMTSTENCSFILKQREKIAEILFDIFSRTSTEIGRR